MRDKKILKRNLSKLINFESNSIHIDFKNKINKDNHQPPFNYLIYFIKFNIVIVSNKDHSTMKFHNCVPKSSLPSESSSLLL